DNLDPIQKYTTLEQNTTSAKDFLAPITFLSKFTVLVSQLSPHNRPDKAKIVAYSALPLSDCFHLLRQVVKTKNQQARQLLFQASWYWVTHM
ncbi:hypothetical protein CHS0354_022268, partial [Potamilus streckersoni]